MRLSVILEKNSQQQCFPKTLFFKNYKKLRF